MQKAVGALDITMRVCVRVSVAGTRDSLRYAVHEYALVQPCGARGAGGSSRGRRTALNGVAGWCRLHKLLLPYCTPTATTCAHLQLRQCFDVRRHRLQLVGVQAHHLQGGRQAAAQPGGQPPHAVAAQVQHLQGTVRAVRACHTMAQCVGDSKLQQERRY